ncbi:hypothetical protein SAY87_027576 [Trapa incisa]|uniref:Uncharacterized GPI-anchored protein At5g19230-like domain-containing protein n=1 Tax=Trapa incisa TaxID=236973 RepID=A0AAN7JN12_9MYRT|nr:hypothetical protein SAY87_027576 [Trapa incisa]
MEALKIRLNLFLVLLLLFFLSVSPAIKCDSDEDDILKGINNYRTSKNLALLGKNDDADCLADELADLLKDQPCNSTNSTGTSNSTVSVSGREATPSNYPELLQKCHINMSSALNDTIMPVCLPNEADTVVINNYTGSPVFSKRLHDSIYTGIGVGSEGNWTVVILITNSSDGSLSTTPVGSSAVGLNSWMPFLVQLIFLIAASLSLL